MLGQRILVLGCCGSGKSTLSRRLGALYGLPVVNLDKLFWKPGWVESTKEEFRALLDEALRQDAWIIDGNFSGSMPWRLEYCDAVIYLVLPRLVCLWGVVSRVAKSYGKTRPDMGEGCPDRFDWEFIKYTWNFEKTQGARNKQLVIDSGRPVVWLRSRREIRRFLSQEAQHASGIKK